MTAHILERHGAALIARDNHVDLRPQAGLPETSDGPRTAVGAQPDAPNAPHGLALTLRGIGKRYGERQVLEGIDLDIAPGEFVAIVGRSGCGKSTLLRLLAQLEQPSEGRIDAAAPGKPGLQASTQPLAQHRDDIRIMFQDARLLPWQRVLDNIALGLSGPQAGERSRQALAQVGLAERGGEWPAVLSGGQRQRIALARALVHAPRLLLLDEPLGALDALTRIEMHRLIEGLWQQHGFTALLVTHDVAEAVALADRVLLIEDGHIALDQRIGLPRPRRQGSPAFARHEDAILRRVLQPPARDEATSFTPPDAPLPPRLRFAV